MVMSRLKKNLWKVRGKQLVQPVYCDTFGLSLKFMVSAVRVAYWNVRNLPIFPAPTELEVTQVVRKPVNESSSYEEKRSSIKYWNCRQNFPLRFSCKHILYVKGSTALHLGQKTRFRKSETRYFGQIESLSCSVVPYRRHAKLTIKTNLLWIHSFTFLMSN